MLDMKSVWEGLGFTRLRVPTVRAVFQVVYCADDIKAAEAADRKDEKFVRPRSGWCTSFFNCPSSLSDSEHTEPPGPGLRRWRSMPICWGRGSAGR